MSNSPWIPSWQLWLSPWLGHSQWLLCQAGPVPSGALDSRGSLQTFQQHLPQNHSIPSQRMKSPLGQPSNDKDPMAAQGPPATHSRDSLKNPRKSFHTISQSVIDENVELWTPWSAITPRMPSPPALPPPGWPPWESSCDGSRTRLHLPERPASPGHLTSPEERGVPGTAIQGTAIAQGAHQGLRLDSAAPQETLSEERLLLRGNSTWGVTLPKEHLRPGLLTPSVGQHRQTLSLHPSLPNLAAFWLRCFRHWENAGIVLHTEEVHDFSSPKPRYGLK